jgi:hypothetical protein
MSPNLRAPAPYTWAEVALYVQHAKYGLDQKHHEFVDDMAHQVMCGRELTLMQRRYLRNLFDKLARELA